MQLKQQEFFACLPANQNCLNVKIHATSNLPKRENTCYFKSAKEAEEIKEKLNSALNSDRLTVLGNIGITQRRITEIFKNEYGITPSQYRNKATQSH